MRKESLELLKDRREGKGGELTFNALLPCLDLGFGFLFEWKKEEEEE